MIMALHLVLVMDGDMTHGIMVGAILIIHGIIHGGITPIHIITVIILIGIIRILIPIMAPGVLWPQQRLIHGANGPSPVIRQPIQEMKELLLTQKMNVQ